MSTVKIEKIELNSLFSYFHCHGLCLDFNYSLLRLVKPHNLYSMLLVIALYLCNYILQHASDQLNVVF